jgi:cytochrome c553
MHGHEVRPEKYCIRRTEGSAKKGRASRLLNKMNAVEAALTEQSMRDDINDWLN